MAMVETPATPEMIADRRFMPIFYGSSRTGHKHIPQQFFSPDVKCARIA
jgi:hypothetical protein